jgi:hypothetical protein
MWMLVNETAYEAERTWVRDRDGAHHWIVVVKATYDVAPDGTLRLADAPLAPLHAPEYTGAPAESSLRYEADLVAMKPATDVYLNAVAHAPSGRPRDRVTASLRVGAIQKTLVVHGERTWRRTLFGRVKPSAAKPFETMPVTYERAFGGFDQTHADPRKHRIDFRNPVGTGFAARRRHLLGKPAPTVVDPVRKPGEGWPAGFGAVASYWSPRKELAGTYDERWMARRRPLLPEDYDPRCLLCAPLDQRPGGYLRGGEPVELTNLTPGGRLAFTLPRLSFRFETYFGSERREHGSELVSVVIDSAGPRLIVVWQTSLPCGNDGDYLDRTVIRPRPGRG